MATVVTLSDQDLSALAELVSQDRESDVPAVGLPPSLLRDLIAQIPCDRLDVLGLDSIRHELWFSQMVTEVSLDEEGEEAPDEPWWALHFDSLTCSHPERTGDLRGIVKNTDFYSRRQWHSVGMYREVLRPHGLEHELQLCLPGPPGPDAGPGRTVRLFFLREPGPDFSEREQGAAHPVAPASATGLSRRRAPTHSRTRAHPSTMGIAETDRRWAHQHPDRPPARVVRGNRAHASGEHLRQAGRPQPHGSRHPGFPGKGGVGTDLPLLRSCTAIAIATALRLNQSTI